MTVGALWLWLRLGTGWCSRSGVAGGSNDVGRCSWFASLVGCFSAFSVLLELGLLLLQVCGWCSG